jgi:hypothetical protein
MNSSPRTKAVAFFFAAVTSGAVVRWFVGGNYCLVPTGRLSRDEIAVAETSVHGFTLYREAGTQHDRMYEYAVWWYQAALSAEWIIGIALGVALYYVLCLLFTRLRSDPSLPTVGPDSVPPG